LKKKTFILSVFISFFAIAVFSQRPVLSIATDLGLQHSFKKEQRYWAVGHTVHMHFNFTPREGLYAWIAYYSNGKFSNNVMATAKSSSTTPQQKNYVNNATMRFKHFSIGWRHYLKGADDVDGTWSLYCYTGFGLLMGKVSNTHSIAVDTSLYNVPVLKGTAKFKRLTFDLGLGWEVLLGGSVYFYNEVRLWIPTTDYPSDHIFVNQNAPLVGSLNFGLRILFD
jgi:hypothetical protein